MVQGKRMWQGQGDQRGWRKETGPDHGNYPPRIWCPANLWSVNKHGVHPQVRGAQSTAHSPNFYFYFFDAIRVPPSLPVLPKSRGASYPIQQRSLQPLYTILYSPLSPLQSYPATQNDPRPSRSHPSPTVALLPNMSCPTSLTTLGRHLPDRPFPTPSYRRSNAPRFVNQICALIPY